MKQIKLPVTREQELFEEMSADIINKMSELSPKERRNVWEYVCKLHNEHFHSEERVYYYLQNGWGNKIGNYESMEDAKRMLSRLGNTFTIKKVVA